MLGPPVPGRAERLPLGNRCSGTGLLERSPSEGASDVCSEVKTKEANTMSRYESRGNQQPGGTVEGAH
jgi:hypothetical protein